MTIPKQVTLIEVAPRDGLQNESTEVSTEDKIQWINLLSQTGVKQIEVTSFVSKKSIPQLADSEHVLKSIQRNPLVSYSALVPNEQGMHKAIAAQMKEIAVFTAASDTFNQHNINCSIEESLERFRPVLKLASDHQIKVRGYISCALGCPYEGTIQPQTVADLTKKLFDLGVNEVSLGDTIGVGTPQQTQSLLEHILSFVPLHQLAMHFHDTYGQAIANIFASLQYGVHRFDSSVAGLGGCPYAQGASGNVATEDVLYLLQGLGIDTGIDLSKMIEAGKMICAVLKRKNQSKVAQAFERK